MAHKVSQEVFLQLLRLGLGMSDDIPALDGVDWDAIGDIAIEQGLQGVLIDAVGRLPREDRPSLSETVLSDGQGDLVEQQYAVQQNAAAGMALLLQHHGIRTYVLKGAVVAECYPRPEHRQSVDMDCYLSAECGDEDIWEIGNRVMEEQGFEVQRDYYKNSTIVLPGLTVENHRYLTPWRGNKTLKKLESLLQSYLHEDKGEDRFEGTWLYRPPVMVSALFLIEHAYSHFLHEGLTWRMVLDWQMFSRRHRDEIDWQEFQARVDEFSFRRFYDSFNRLVEYLVGELAADGLQPMDLQMLSDIWSPLDLHDSVTGWCGKLALAGNTWRARWKYRQFTDMSWLKALWIQAKGVLLEKEVRL